MTLPPSWCLPSNPTPLTPFALKFLSHLDLPSIHPQCLTGSTKGVIPPHRSSFAYTSVLERLITLYFQAVPSLLAMAELWLRLFAFLVAPLCLSQLVYDELTTMKTTPTTHDGGGRNRGGRVAISILGLLSCTALTTDVMYITEYGIAYGGTLFALTALLTMRKVFRFRGVGRGRDQIALVVCTVACVLAIVSRVGGVRNDDVPNIDPKLYYSSSNPVTSRLAETALREYAGGGAAYYDGPTGVATPWLITGDARTGIPFLVNPLRDTVKYHRVYLPTFDDEAVALDICFPPADNDDDNDKPIYLVLHGLNGGSQEGFVLDFVETVCHRQNAVVVIMIARGLMDTPVFGDNVFHGARVDDVHYAATALREVARRMNEKKGAVVAGVGYSMGAIVVANYVARYGKDCALTAAVSVSGGLDMRENLWFERGRKLWQPLLAVELRSMILQKLGEKYERRLTREEMLEFLRATSISRIDEYAVVTYNNYHSINHYYSEMSAMGDIPNHNPNTTSPRLSNVSIPLLVVHALDDPLCTWRTMGHPDTIVTSGEGYVMMLLTKTGGHVGWPVGWNPRGIGWGWMNDVARDFVEGVVKLGN
mmetsp:Transcript_47516/g.57549  ORF Transcript_47516/g.57549 Transcript_47516/m.57549 type:complete len:593 (+) Transcript_47516:69-1847(+)